MKFLSLIALMSVLTLSNVNAADTNISGATTGAATWIALSVYAPEVAAGLAGTSAIAYTVVSSEVTALANQKALIRNAVNSDAQDFFSEGKVSEALAQSVRLLQKSNNELSVSEAIDALVISVNE